MATASPAACAPEVLSQIRRALAAHPIAELEGLLPSELTSLAELICAMSAAGGAFRTRFERLSSREELVALAATHGIPVAPSLLERFARLAAGSGCVTLSDAQLDAVSAGAGDQALAGLGALLQMVQAGTRF